MTRAVWILPTAFLALAACGSTGGTGPDIRVSGSAAVGASTGGVSGHGGPIGSGPPPGRTASERQARKDYYRGPRGDEF